jgi:hypothetical protein
MLGVKIPILPYIFGTCLETDVAFVLFTNVFTLPCFLARFSVFHLLVHKTDFTFSSFLANFVSFLLFFTNLIFVKFSVGPFKCFSLVSP